MAGALLQKSRRYADPSIEDLISVTPDARLRFRQLAQAWLTLVAPSPAPPMRIFDLREIEPGRVAVAERAQVDDDMAFRDILLVRGDFRCGQRCHFSRPVYAGGNAEVGRGSHLHAITAEGSLLLGPGARVETWADSGAVLDVRAGAGVAGEAVAGRSILLGIDAALASLHAPEICTHGRTGGIAEPLPAASYLEIRPPSSGPLPDLSVVRGWKPGRMRALGADTWVYDGALHLPMPLLSTARLVVRGSLWCPPGSLLEADVKTGEWLEVGASSLCRGNLSARGDLTLHGDCLFSGDLRAGGRLRLCRGVRGFRETGGVVVEGAAGVALETDVVVRGRIAAHADRIVVSHADSLQDLGWWVAEG